ncbi:MAG: Gfo/Idh/MocA family oxidoreductase [Candidatus Hydrogenedentes bacterium]|nr:Gfo/Idh/MocA family oxidoreductase [Candidatus Hydrogenedentota bacterium]
METYERRSLSRRQFLERATVGTAAFTILAPSAARTYAANDKLHLGLIGCGGRGTWIGQLFQENSETKVVALHDYFRDRAESAGKRLEVDASRWYTGLDGYHELLSGEVDAVAVESPPYFHPQQSVAALEAGKHVYLAKPIAVDVAGCLDILKASQRAGGRLSLLVDFQTRNNELFREAARRIQAGMIGAPVCGQAYYHTGRLNVQAPPGTEEARLRNWVFDKALSGDIIVEQNIHVLDVANWFLGGHPVKAHGYGGRKARTDVGDCWDHFVVTYHYPNDVLLDFSSNQFVPGFNDLCTRIYGEKGTVDAHYGGPVSINAKSEKWPGGTTDQIYREGAVNNIKDFCAGIRKGQFLNNIEESANSTLTSILGRMAAYKGRTVTWKEMMRDHKRLDPKLKLG